MSRFSLLLATALVLVLIGWASLATVWPGFGFVTLSLAAAAAVIFMLADLIESIRRQKGDR